jgi:hypothetical protein
MNVDGRTTDLLEYGALDLGSLEKAIGGDKTLNSALAAVLHNGSWSANTFPVVINGFRQVRNPGTHAAAIDRQTASHWRQRLIGVGCTGELVELARTSVK